MKFRSLLEKHSLGDTLLANAGEVRRAYGLSVGISAIMDATIIRAPSSPKSADK